MHDKRILHEQKVYSDVQQFNQYQQKLSLTSNHWTQDQS